LKFFSMIGISFLLLLTACGDVAVLAPDAILPDGGQYRGDIKDGLFDGEGELQYSTGSQYEGQFEKGLLHGRGIYTHADGWVLEGEFVAGSATGHVLYTEPAFNEEYRGEMLDWKYHGMGTLKTEESTYVGEFKKGKFDGQGQLTYDSGVSYSGGFKDNEFSGQGVYKYGDSVYEGEFENGVLNGQGSITDTDGGVYVGEVSEWVASGKGQKTDAEGNVTIATFEGGFATGEGRFIGVDGRQYEGDFAYGKFDGSGTLTLADLSVYVGEFSYGEYHGEGVLTVAATDETPASTQAGRWGRGRLVFDAKTGEHLAAQAEVALEQHQTLLENAITALKPSDADVINAYFLGVAGDGTQSVFRREIEFVNDELARRYATQGRSITLINHHDSAGLYPLATTRSFAAAVSGLADRMDKDNDVLFVYFSSHGSKEHALSLDHDSIDLPPMTANYIGETLRESNVKWKVVMVSACYAGGFIPELDDGHTLILTAADAESTSFGCSEESDMTYFGKALFKEVLAKDRSVSFDAAFAKAKEFLLKWEKDQELTASNPMIKSPAKVLTQLAKLEAATQRPSPQPLSSK